MRTEIVLVCLLVLGAIGPLQAEVFWVEDFEAYDLDTYWWSNLYNPACPWIDYGQNSQLDFAWARGDVSNGTAMYTSGLGYQAWTKRAFGATVDTSQAVQVTARVTQSIDMISDPTAVPYPYSSHVFLSNVGIGIAGGKVCWGTLEYGYSAVNTSRGYTYLEAIPLAIDDPWYDVKIVVHPQPGDANDIADLYYKRSIHSDWITVVESFDTGHKLDGHVHLHTYNISSAGRWRGYIDHIKLSNPPADPECSDVYVKLAMDLTDDCKVDIDDLLFFSETWLSSNYPADPNSSD